MGGRGSAGGASGGISDRQILSRLPDFPGKINLPQLEESEKQIAWARKIRQMQVGALVQYATNRQSDGRPFGYFNKVVEGKKSVLSQIKGSPLVRETTGNLQREKIDGFIRSYNDVTRRYSTVKEIFETHTSAKYWIDHRDSHGQYELMAIIDGKKR